MHKNPKEFPLTYTSCSKLAQKMRISHSENFSIYVKNVKIPRCYETSTGLTELRSSPQVVITDVI